MYFFNCDWGTTRFRLRLVRIADCAIVGEYQSDDGVAALASVGGDRGARFEAVLAAGTDALIAQRPADLQAAPVMISGMASSSIGWQALEYATLPLGLDGTGTLWRQLHVHAKSASLAGRRIYLLSGVRDRSDVLRGEETQFFGLFRLAAAERWGDPGIVVLPGTHSKHLEFSRPELHTFRTYMTGELYEVLSRHSILRHSVGEWAGDGGEHNAAAFREGVDCGAALPLSRALFQVRTRQVLDATSPASNRAFLSGLLIGSELAPLAAAESRAHAIVLAAPPALSKLYQSAFEVLGLADRLFVVPPSDVERLSALGQAVVLQGILSA